MLTVVMIRDFPDLPIGWRGSYILKRFRRADRAIMAAKAEILRTGRKYGALLYRSDGMEECTIARNFEL